MEDAAEADAPPLFKIRPTMTQLKDNQALLGIQGCCNDPRLADASIAAQMATVDSMAASLRLKRFYCKGVYYTWVWVFKRYPYGAPLPGSPALTALPEELDLDFQAEFLGL